MATDQPDVYAAGDIVEFPLFTVGLKNANVQHWQMAHAHGNFIWIDSFICSDIMLG